MVTIRRMIDADLEACAQVCDKIDLFAEYGMRGPKARKTLQSAWESPDADLWVAESGGEVLGFAWVSKKSGLGRCAYLRLIAVSQPGKGVGETLLRHLEGRPSFKNGLLLLCTSKNTPARRFYERLGYKNVGEIPGFAHPRLDECIYWKAPAS